MRCRRVKRPLPCVGAFAPEQLPGPGFADSSNGPTSRAHRTWYLDRERVLADNSDWRAIRASAQLCRALRFSGFVPTVNP